MDEICSAWNCLVSFFYWTSTNGLASVPLTTLNDQCFMSFWISGSSNFLPISRLASYTVFSGFFATWFLAASPISRSSSVNAT